MRVSVNGRPVELDEGATIRDAALSLGVEPEARGVAVAVDGEVIPRSLLATAELREGQRVEIVAAIQGGCR